MKKRKKRKPFSVILGVTSSIACYKAAVIASIFTKEKCMVKTVLTPEASKFISPVLFRGLTGNAAFVEQLSPGDAENHIALSDWADVFVIAPATANTISKIAAGICDNLLTTLVVSRRCPLFVAPAMETAMWENGIIKKNILILKKQGIKIIGPDAGRLASGGTGVGRMSEPEEIVSRVLAEK
ncbi:MAG: flavoprotein [bacterium]